MAKHSIKVWFRAARIFSLTGAVIPVTLGSILAIKESKFQLIYFLISLLAAVLLQASVNILSDYDDFINKVDTEDSYGSSGVLAEKLLTPEELFRVGRLILALGCLLGVFLAFKKGLFILLLGAVGALSGYSYTGKPLNLKYKGLGAPLVFIIFGPLMVLGGYFVQLQRINTDIFLISIPVGLLTTAILHANDIRDIYHDRKAGIKTLSMIIGVNKAIKIYDGLILISYISIILMSLFKIIPYWSLICLITLPLAFKNINKLHLSSGVSKVIATLDKDTAKLQLLFGIMFIISILVSLI